MKKLLFIALLLLLKISVLLAPVVRCAVITQPSPYCLQGEWLTAIILAESGEKGSSAINPEEPQAKGILQIWPIMVEDVNRILGYKKYTLEDRLDDKKAIEMFWIYQYHYNPSLDPVKMCKIWVGGPNGMNKSSTESYYQKVKINTQYNLLAQH